MQQQCYRTLQHTPRDIQPGLLRTRQARGLWKHANSKASLFLVALQELSQNFASAITRSPVLQRVLLVVTLIGTSALMGDGVITPAISGLSHASGWSR
jgi:hypothetical protein